jgi:hypothetical protein
MYEHGAKIERGEWKVESGKWRVENGEWDNLMGI